MFRWNSTEKYISFFETLNSTTNSLTDLSSVLPLEDKIHYEDSDDVDVMFENANTMGQKIHDEDIVRSFATNYKEA